MKNVRTLGLVPLLLAACSSAGVYAPALTDELLSGEVLFGESVDVADIRSDEILMLNDAMREYVAERVQGDPTARSRLRKLIGGMIDDGLLTMDYDPNLTYTAAETFETRQGNCLSFSILFAALGREADLDLSFQMVDIPPSFRADGEMIILNNHINVVVRGVRRDVNHVGEYVVDFNTAEYNGNYKTKRVADTYAIALYFSNVAVESMQNGDTREAFRFLKKGIETDPKIAGLWVNLGALYSKNGHYELAEQAYRQALAIQPSNKSALTNMAVVLLHQGREEEARRFSRRVTFYRDRNPYYHYTQAQAAYQEDRLEDALHALEEAIRLKKDEHQFYFLSGLIHEKLQQFDLAASDYRKARDTAE